jgi:hypothetical protein
VLRLLCAEKPDSTSLYCRAFITSFTLIDHIKSLTLHPAPCSQSTQYTITLTHVNLNSRKCFLCLGRHFRSRTLIEYGSRGRPPSNAQSSAADRQVAFTSTTQRYVTYILLASSNKGGFSPLRSTTRTRQGLLITTRMPLIKKPGMSFVIHLSPPASSL